MRVLIFGTTYADTEAKWNLARQWGVAHAQLNPDCDLLLVDSDSPHQIDDSHAPVILLGNNIGHLSRGGADGWGRAFCLGLHYAIDHDYDYAVHIEGDSLCTLDVMLVCRAMSTHNLCAVSVPVRGTKHLERDWIETGLMFFNVDYLRDENIAEQYNWKDSSYKNYPQTPEFWLRRILGRHVQMQSGWRTLRDDKHILTTDSVRDYVWVTHTTPEIYHALMDTALTHAGFNG